LIEIQKRFAEEGIEIPYPKRDVFIKKVADRNFAESALETIDRRKL